jgi:hypothetical protein
LQLAREHCRTLSFWILEFPNWMGSRLLPHDLGKARKQGAGADSQAPGHFSMRCMQAGAAGYVCKQQELTELLSAIKAVLSGTATFPIRRCTRGAQVWVVPAKDMVERLSAGDDGAAAWHGARPTRKLPIACFSATRRSVPTRPGCCSNSMPARWWI